MSGTTVKLLTQYEFWENSCYVFIKVRLTGITWMKVKRGRVVVNVSFQDRSLSLTVSGELGNYKLPFNDKELNMEIIGDKNPLRSVWRRRHSRYAVSENYIKLTLRKKIQESWMNRSNEVILLAESSDKSSGGSESSGK
ncbi:uncharacterized protein LOC144433524 [Glandiceps talaboti]